MSDVNITLAILAIFFGYLYTMFISYKVRLKVDKKREVADCKDELSVDLTTNKKE